MNGQTSQKRRSFLKINFDFPYSWNPYPLAWQRHVTPAELNKANFSQTSKTTFEKSFCNFLTLRVKLERGSKVYDWILNESAFKAMIVELEEIKTYLDNVAEAHYAATRSIPARIKISKNPEYWRTTILPKIMEVTNAVAQRKKVFFEKYRDFISINDRVMISTPFARYKYFFFDACKTTNQLHLYFKFIELFLDVFSALKRSKPNTRKINNEAIKYAIYSYHLFLRLIKEIRTVYLAKGNFKQVQDSFPSVSESLLLAITLDSAQKKGWVYKASDLAIDLVCPDLNTTPGNFKQILKKEKKYALRVRCQIADITDIQDAMCTGFVMQDSMLSSENIPKDEWLALYRYNFSQMSSVHMDTELKPPPPPSSA